MPRRMMLFGPPILAGLVAAGTLTAPPVRAAAASCITRPSAAAPQGSHWYYRVDRAANRKCWFLAAESTKASKSAAPKGLASARPGSAGLTSRPADGPAAAESFAGAMTGEPGQVMDFSTRWPARPRPAASIRLDPLPMSSNYADEQATAATPDEETPDDLPLIWPVFTAAEVTAAEQPPQSAIRLGHAPAFLAGVLTLAAIFGAAMTLSAARRPGRGAHRDQSAPAPEVNASRARRHAAPAVDRSNDVVRKPVAAARRAAIDHEPLKARNPDHDIEDRLSQLLQDWRRVAA